MMQYCSQRTSGRNGKRNSTTAQAKEEKQGGAFRMKMVAAASGKRMRHQDVSFSSHVKEGRKKNAGDGPH